MEIRQLTANDLFLLSEIVEKISEDVATKLVSELSDRQLGFTMLITVAKYIPTEIRAFLAIITDQTPEDLGKKGFSEPLKILKALWINEDFQDFLLELKSIRELISTKQLT
jgi:hypothetical protein